MPTTDITERAHDVIAATLAEWQIDTPICIGAFPICADQVARARAIVRDHLADHPACDTAVLLVSEMATNALRHSHSSFFALTITRTTTDRVRIAVIDEGRSGIPRLYTANADAESGRGIALIDALATRWGITRRPGIGAAVWLELQGTDQEHSSWALPDG